MALALFDLFDGRGGTMYKLRVSSPLIFFYFFFLLNYYYYYYFYKIRLFKLNFLSSNPKISSLNNGYMYVMFYIAWVWKEDVLIFISAAFFLTRVFKL
jgi:hypothetical protein